MISCFPDPYPDELLYSICARYSDRVQYPDKQSVVKELFGNKRIVAGVDLPGHLNDLVTALPPGGYYTVDRLIDNHTLLPFYSPYYPSELIGVIREEMRGSSLQKLTHRGIGLLNSLQLPRYLRFCPLCVQEDKKEFGECYWHRLHQVLGVEVCLVHEIPLENSEVLRRNPRCRFVFISAKKATHTTRQRSFNISIRDRENLLRIAHDINWLLKQCNLFSNRESLHNRYIRLLSKHNLCSIQGKLRLNKLVEGFKCHYSPEILKLLQCDFDEQSNAHWLADIFRPTSWVKHPLRHLLVTNFLGYTAEEFFKLPSKEVQPFGDGPWPCLNPVCKYFRQPVIKECLVTNLCNRTKLVGRFRCVCGFLYSRTEPDTCAEDQFKKSRTITIYGSLWESALRNLWANEAISIVEIGKQLGVSDGVVKRQAALLKLPFPRPSVRRVIELSPVILSRVNRETRTPKTLEFYQGKLLEAIAENPLAGRTELYESNQPTYTWLKKHCPDWLETHLPPPKSRKKLKPSIVDWKKRDAELVAAVKASALYVRSSFKHPIRITKTEIGRHLGDNRLLLRFPLAELPLTKEALAEVVETHEEFAVRKIEWAAKGFLEEKVCPTQGQLLRRAKISSQSLHTIAAQQVKEAIDAALQSLASIDAVSGADNSSVNDSGTLHEV